MDRFEAIRKIARVALRLPEARLQRRLAALQVEAVQRALEDARLWRPAPESVGVVGRHGVLSFRHDVLWQRMDGGDEGPFCPGCWGREQRAVLMQVSAWTWSCPACNRVVRIPHFLESCRPLGRP